MEGSCIIEARNFQLLPVQEISDTLFLYGNKTSSAMAVLLFCQLKKLTVRAWYLGTPNQASTYKVAFMGAVRVEAHYATQLALYGPGDKAWIGHC